MSQKNGRVWGKRGTPKDSLLHLFWCCCSAQEAAPRIPCRQNSQTPTFREASGRVLGFFTYLVSLLRPA